jgi:hypothetical protein
MNAAISAAIFAHGVCEWVSVRRVLLLLLLAVVAMKVLGA